MKKILCVLILLYSCKNNSDYKKLNSNFINEDSVVVAKMIKKLILNENNENNKIYGVWVIDSVREKNKLRYRYSNIDSAFSAFDFRKNDKLFNAKKNDIGIEEKFLGDFKVFGDSVFVYSEKENTVQGFKLEMKNNTLLKITNGDPIGYKNFERKIFYLSRMPDYSFESKMKKLYEERTKDLKK